MSDEHMSGSYTIAGTETASSADRPGPDDITEALRLVTALPWRLGRTAGQARAARGRMSALIHHVAALLNSGWTAADIEAALNGTAGIDQAPDAAAQHRRWRQALNRAKHTRIDATTPRRHDAR